MRFFLWISLLTLVSCSVKTPVQVPANAGNVRPPEAYLDLEPGWRLRAVGAVMRSGSISPAGEVMQQEDLNLTMKASKDLLGYETDYFAVEKKGKGVQVRFASGERVVEGKTLPVDKPMAAMLRLPEGMGQVRMLYLLEASVVNHSMAVLAGKTREDVDALTKAVQANPETACVAGARSVCEWMPPKVAVRAEKPGTAGTWVPVR